MAKKKKNNLELTPLMTLSALAIFAMMPIMFSLTNSQQKARASKAAEPEVVVVTPTPEESPDVMEK